SLMALAFTDHLPASKPLSLTVDELGAFARAPESETCLTPGQVPFAQGEDCDGEAAGWRYERSSMSAMILAMLSVRHMACWTTSVSASLRAMEPLYERERARARQYVCRLGHQRSNNAHQRGR